MKKKVNGRYIIYQDDGNLSMKYSTISCIGYMIRSSWKMDKWYIPLVIVSAGCGGLLELLWSLFGKYIVDFALGDGVREHLLIVMSAIIAAIFVMRLLFKMLGKYAGETKLRKCSYLFSRQLYEKQLDTDYENLENPSTKNLFERAKQAVDKLVEFYYRIENSVCLIISLFGWIVVVSTLSPWLILVIVVPTVGYYYIVKYKISWYGKNTMQWVDIDRKLSYIRNKSADFSSAKDIRLYHMQGWLGEMFGKFMEKRLFWYKKQDRVEGLNGFFQILIVSVRDIAAYGFIVWQVSKGNMTAGEFLLYFNSVGQIADAFYHIMDHLASFGWLTMVTSWYREFLELPDKTNRGEGVPLPTGDFDIRFEKVCYRYGGAEKDTIHDLSFTIKSGEKIAIVGNNGAGKTTIIKLLCGIYRCTGGQIYIGEHRIEEYNRDELFKLYATVFQDIHVMPSTIAENIVMSGAVDLKSLDYAIEHSGIGDKICGLPDGLGTYLVKSVYDDATDLSGGEMQKLALARALYKQKTHNSGVLILDEPTAALDPIAEQNMYQEYAKFTEGKISVFISHRLASTQFCDRIFYLKEGRISECGTHNELLNAGGEYAHIFQVQSQYYRKKETLARVFEEGETCYE